MLGHHKRYHLCNLKRTKMMKGGYNEYLPKHPIDVWGRAEVKLYPYYLKRLLVV